MSKFKSKTVLKRDLFSETLKGYMVGTPDVPVVRRVVTATPLWTRPLAWLLARREIATLRAVSGIDGTPRLLMVDRDGLYRTWSEGTPLHLARPARSDWYKDAFRLLRMLRRARITHNDLAKPQNWLMTPDGRAAVIDFQLASRHRHCGFLYRVMAYEDFRHLLKQMKAFAPHLLTPTARRVLAKRSLPSRVWRSTGKRVYNLATRRFLNWSDGEGTQDRLDREGPAILAALKACPGVRSVTLTTFPMPSKGVGIYAFVESDMAGIQQKLETAQKGLSNNAHADRIQLVPALPRGRNGAVRIDLLNLIAMNQICEAEALIGDDRSLAECAAPIIAGRRNFSDRRISHLEKTETMRDTGG